MKNIIIAYEPVWAIGTGNNATPLQAEEVHDFIRNLLFKFYGENISGNARIIYGGSVTPENIEQVMKGVSGVLVGGASLNFDKFVKIVKGASKY